MIGTLGRRLRLRSSLFSVGLIAVALAAALSGCAVQGGEACTISGTASFTPGLTTTAKAVSYTFSGTFTGCHSVGGDSTIKSGTVTASGSGSNLACTGGNSSGTATVNWNNGQSSTINITTSGALNAVVVTGNHWVLDGVGGWIVLAIGWCVVAGVERLRHTNGRDPAQAAP